MHSKEIIAALLAILIALIWSSWDLVCDNWKALPASHKWVVGTSAVMLFLLAFFRSVVPLVWDYGNRLIL